MTDIDALVFDSRTGTVGLFQLKWQDMFGDSLRARESRRKNFTRETSRWVDDVCNWLSKRTPQQIAAELGLRHFGAERVGNVRLFVLGRHFAHFSGDIKPDERAAWGLWPKVLRLVYEHYEPPERSDVLKVGSSSDNYADGIEWLFHTLRNDSPTLKRLSIDGEQEVKLGDVTLVIRSPQGVKN